MAPEPIGEPQGNHRVRVILADDSWHYALAIRDALRLEPDLDVVAVAYSAEELLEHVRRDEPDVILLDLDLPVMGGVAVCNRLRECNPAVAIVILTALADPELARRCLLLGARAYVVKHDRSDPERVAEAVRSAARGDHLLDREIHDFLVGLAARAPDPAREAGVTPRELEVLPLVAEGLRNKEIAQRLGVSEQTVKNHLGNIGRKLGARNRVQVVAEARRRGILE